MFRIISTTFILVLCIIPVFLEKVTFSNVAIRVTTEDGEKTNTITAEKIKDNIPQRVIILSITNQNIPILLEGSLAEVIAESAIHLNHNGIVEIKGMVFSETESPLIDLSHNKIETISQNAFDKLGANTEINLSHNRLSVWDQPYFNFNLKGLNLEHNLIRRIGEQSFANFRTPRHIYYINLRHNEITEIGPDVFLNTVVNDLDLSHNKIEKISSNSFDNSTIESINLSHNKISEWNPEWFNNCTRLLNISLKHNLIETLPTDSLRNFYGSKDLTLELSYNKIKTIESSPFEGVESFEELLLDHNEIKHISAYFIGEIVIQKLDLGWNKFRCVDNYSYILKAKKENNLKGNKLECFCLDKLKDSLGYNSRVILPTECLPSTAF